MARSQRSALPVYSTYTPPGTGLDVQPAINAADSKRVYLNQRTAGGSSWLPSARTGSALQQNAAVATAAQLGSVMSHTPFQNAFQKARDRYRQRPSPWGSDAGSLIGGRRQESFSTHGNAEAGAVAQSARERVSEAAQQVVQAGPQPASGLVIPSVFTPRERR